MYIYRTHRTRSSWALASKYESIFVESSALLGNFEQ